MTLLRDPLWQFIGVVVAVAGLIAPLALYLLRRSRRLIIYDISTVPIIRLDRKFESSFEISFEGKKLKSAYLSIITLLNQGNSPIRREDFDEPLALDFSEGKPIFSFDKPEVLSFDVSGNEIDLRAGLTNNRIVVEPFLLNQLERIKITVITSGDGPEPRIILRMIGGNLISKKRYDNSPFRRMRIRLVDLLPQIAGLLFGLWILRKFLG